MAKYKVQLLFNLLQQGWSEVYFNSYTDQATAETQVLALAGKRTPMLNKNAKVVGYRLSKLTDQGVPVGRTFSADITGLAVGAPSTGTKDQTNVSLNVRFQNQASDTAGLKTMHLRGWPDGSAHWDDDGQPVFDNAFKNPWNTFVNYMITGQFQISTFDKQDGSNPKFLIETFEYDAAGRLVINLAADDNDTVVGQRIKLFKMPGPDKACVNGLHRVLERITSTRLILDRINPAGLQAAQPAAGGFYRREKYQWDAITSVRDYWWSTRNTGRAFFATAGRQRRKC